MLKILIIVSSVPYQFSRICCLLPITRSSSTSFLSLQPGMDLPSFDFTPTLCLTTSKHPLPGWGSVCGYSHPKHAAHLTRRNYLQKRQHANGAQHQRIPRQLQPLEKDQKRRSLTSQRTSIMHSESMSMQYGDLGQRTITLHKL